MAQKKNSGIKIGNVKGNVFISKNQTGGIAAQDNNPSNTNPNHKSFYNNRYVLFIGFLASLLGILGYLGFQPKAENNYKQLPIKIDSGKTKTQPKLKMENNKQNKSKHNEPISIGNVNGDIVISQNQTGGYTAHTINIQNNAKIAEPEYLWGIKSLNTKTEDHYTSIFILKVESQAMVPFVEVSVKGKSIYDMDIFQPGRPDITGMSGKTDFGYVKTLLNAKGEYQVIIKSNEIENFNEGSVVFVDKYKL